MTNDRVRERNEYIARLSLEGLSTRTILKNVNSVGLEKEWQPLQSERSVQRIIANHFRAQRAVPAHKIRERWETEFDVAMGQLDFLIEKLALYGLRRKKWAPFEHTKFIKTQFDMLQRKFKLLQMQKELEVQLPPIREKSTPKTQFQKDMQPIIAMLDREIEKDYERECLSV